MKRGYHVEVKLDLQRAWPATAGCTRCQTPLKLLGVDVLFNVEYTWHQNILAKYSRGNLARNQNYLSNMLCVYFAIGYLFCNTLAHLTSYE